MDFRLVPVRHLAAFLAAFVSTMVFCAHAAEQTVKYPSLKLRGYGSISGTFNPTTVDGRPASTLQISCDDEAKAKLVQAKYISDLQVLPGVSPVDVPLPLSKTSHVAENITIAQGHLPGYRTDNVTLAAARDGKNVIVFSASTPEDLGELIERQLGTASTTRQGFAPEVTVPMYLDRFDKFSFRFYYGPFSLPEGVNNVTDYNPTQDFTYAKSIHAGQIFWHTPLAVDNAEGITDLPWLLWAEKAAAADHLPVGINDGLEHDTWAYNRFPEQMVGYQPEFLGGWYGSMNFSEEITSWNGLQAKDQEYAQMQKSIRQLDAYDNITSFLEPHEEMSHGVADLLLEYGPVADAGYRTFLREKYGTIGVVSQRWFGDAGKLKSWSDVHSPELASFLGWGPEALDLTGEWRVDFNTPFGPSAGATTLNDSHWPTVQAPGNAIVRWLPRRKPAVYRRHITVDAGWRAAHSKVWLYCWDLNDVSNAMSNDQDQVQVYVNGTLLPEKPLKITGDHWVALDASQALHDGDNLVAITLPMGMFNYRVYLSPHEPVLYPNLGAQENARWVDYYDWNVWFRGNAVRRGSQMIRQVDPNRGIELMAPNSYQESISDVAKAYGGDFHDTGSMAGSFQDDVAALAQGMQLPVTVEPGGPAHTIPDLKAFFGRWLMEGANEIDYFGHEGDILWFPDRKKALQDHLPIYTSIGKYHTPTTEVAALYSMRNAGLLAFPWQGGEGYGASNPQHLGSGEGKWNVRAPLRGDFDADSLMEASFARGDAARYKVILDTNTSIMDPPLLSQIEKYVRDGGTFVTYVQTGRETSLQPDSWPIEKLTGYHVTSLTQSNAWQPGQITWASGQPIFSGDWLAQIGADGLSMKKVSPDAQDLAYWKDGSVAIGMRHLGKGTIIEVGCRFTSWGLPDRIDREIWVYLKKAFNRLTEYGFSTDPNASIFTPQLTATGKLFEQILDWRGVPRVPGQLAPKSEDGLLRHFESNSGLYDVWVVWNQSKDRDLNTTLHLSGVHPAWALNLLDNTKTMLSGPDLPVHLPPLELAVYLTPQDKATNAPQEWFELQRRWWQGTAAPGTPIPQVDHRIANELTQNCAFVPVSDPEGDVSKLVSLTYDDSAAPRMDLGIFTIPDHPQLRHAVFRRKFTVPANWTAGPVGLWIRSWIAPTFLGRARVYLDGKLVSDWESNGLEGDLLGGALKPGTSHLLALEIRGDTALVGSRGPMWLAYHPEPAARLNLAGDWSASSDALHFDATAHLPGTISLANRRMVKIDAAQSNRTVVFHALTSNGTVFGVIVNGRFVPRFHHNIGAEMNLAITPWVKFGQENEFILMGSDKAEVKELSLEFHKKGSYP